MQERATIRVNIIDFPPEFSELLSYFTLNTLNVIHTLNIMSYFTQTGKMLTSTGSWAVLHLNCGGYRDYRG